jgi:hypothetical protein
MSTTLPLASICDLDNVISWSPLVLGTPSTESYATGGNAIARRVLYSWARNGGLLDLCGKTFDDGDLAELRAQLAALAEAEDYVQSCDLTLTIDDDTNLLQVVAAEVLIDGQVYPLEVTTADAAAAITALGGATG